MNFINRLIHNRTQKKRRERDLYIESLIQIEERVGQMWITCDGHGVVPLADDASQREILDLVESIRATAIAFDRHENMNEPADDTNPVILNVHPRHNKI